MKTRDKLIFIAVAAIAGILLTRQYFAGSEARKLSQPENNQVLALEVAKLTASNADLRQEVIDTEAKLNSYKKSASDQVATEATINSELKIYKDINGDLELQGRGIVLTINHALSQTQLVDLVNNIRNIGVDGFAVNGQRININSYFKTDDSVQTYQIDVVGNPSLLKSALTRKGGFLDQIFPNTNEYSIIEKDTVVLPPNPAANFIYSKVIN